MGDLRFDRRYTPTLTLGEQKLIATSHVIERLEPDRVVQEILAIVAQA